MSLSPILLAGGLSFFLRYPSWDFFLAAADGVVDSYVTAPAPLQKMSPEERKRLFVEEQNKVYEELLKSQTPKTDRELRDLVDKLRAKAVALGTDFDLAEGIINAWDKILAPGQTTAQIVRAFKKAEGLFTTPEDRSVLEGLKLARGFFLIPEKKYSEARQIALEGEKSRFASVRKFSGLLKIDAELRLGGYPAPSYSTHSFDLSRQKGKVTVLYFWQSWCPPCAKKLPELQEIQRQWGNQLTVVGISNADLEPNAADIDKMREKTGVTFQQITDRSVSTGTFRVFNYPRTIIIDKKGNAWLLFPHQDVKKELQRFL